MEADTSQKGLLVNHYMGTGKTLTGLNLISYFLEKYDDKRIVLTVPIAIKGVWIKEIKKRIKNYNEVFNKLEIIFYEDFNSFVNDNKKTKENFITSFIQNKKSLKDFILILDEGHHLVEYIRNKYKKIDRLNILNKLKKFHKIILMTGTPFFQDVYDIVYITNIVSGKEILPYNTNEFRQKYFSYSYFDSTYYGYINPILGTNVPTFLAASIFTFLYLYDATQIASGASTIVMAKYLALFGLTVSGTSFLTIATLGMLPIILGGVLAVFLYLTKKEHLSELKQINTKKVIKDINAYVDLHEKPNEMNTLIQKMKKYKLANEDKCYNEKKSFYYSKLCPEYFTKMNKGKFPHVLFETRHVPYSEYQLKIFLQMTYNLMSSDEANTLELSQIKKDFNEVSDEELYDLLGAVKEAQKTQLQALKNSLFNKIETFEQYKDKGRILGNLSSKYYNSNNYGTNKKNEVSHSPKFSEILNTIGDKFAAIYSNFDEKGIQLFEAFLKEYNLISKEKIKFEILRKKDSLVSQEKKLENFENSSKGIHGKNDEKFVQILLLHPSHTEGISVKGAQQLHILEPIQNYATYEQVCARVVRFESHEHFKDEKKSVKVFQWISNVGSLIQELKNKIVKNKSKSKKTKKNTKALTNTPSSSSFTHMKQKVKFWWRNSKEVFYIERLSEFNNDVTPDSLVYKNMIKTKRTIEEFKYNLNSQTKLLNKESKK